MPPRREDQKALTSIRVFRKFIKRVKEQVPSEDGKGFVAKEVLNAEGVVSKECYALWLKARKTLPSDPHKVFQRSLSGHLGAVDGRLPFTPEEEQAVLKVLRRKGIWPCFADTGVKYGATGYRAKGYHEKRLETGEADAYAGLHDEDDDLDDDEDEARHIAAIITQTPQTVQHQTSKRPGQTGPASVKRMRDADDNTRKDASTKSPANDTLAGSEASSVTLNDDADLNDEDITDPFALYFWKLAKTALSLMYDRGADAWDTILGIRRFVIISMGNFGGKATYEEIAKVFEEHCALHPGHAIIVLDNIAKVPRDRVLMTNREAEEWVGKISARDGGINRPLFPRSYWWTALKCSVLAWTRYPEEQSCFIEFYNTKMEPIPARLCVRVLRQYGISICRATRVQDAPERSHGAPV